MPDTSPQTMTYPEQRLQITGYLKRLSHDAPDTMKGFAALHRAATDQSALDVKTKELISLSISVATRCDGCIAYHTHDALKAGATREEVIDALGVAILMGGGPATIYATHALKALDEFEPEFINTQ